VKFSFHRPKVNVIHQKESESGQFFVRIRHKSQKMALIEGSAILTFRKTYSFIGIMIRGFFIFIFILKKE
jgi:hypothetical protein